MEKPKLLNRKVDFSDYYMDFNEGLFDKCRIIKTKYTNNYNTALGILDNNENLESLITTNLDIKLPENQVFLKTWGENDGLLDYLIEQKIIKLTGEKYQSGFVEVLVAEVLNFNDVNEDFMG